MVAKECVVENVVDSLSRPLTDAAKVLEHYIVHPVSGEAMVGLFEHVRCTWSERVPFPLGMARGVAMALEHHIVGCKTLRPR